MMLSLILAASTVVSPEILSNNAVRGFGTAAWAKQGSRALQEIAMTRWPSPQGLAAIWHTGELTRVQKLSVLLGGAAHHDPLLLPVYREALAEENQTIRLAAHFGYRDLIGDRLPRQTGAMADSEVQLLIQEIQVMERSLRRGSLTMMWLEALLQNEGKSTGRWQGIVPRREAVDCLRALDRLVHAPDLPEILQAYELSTEDRVQLSLMRLAEGLGLRKFVIRPRGENAGWGSKMYDEALQRLDVELAVECRRDAESWIREGFEDLGVIGVSPFHVDACPAWREIARHPYHSWGRLVAQQLYACGAPPLEISILSSRSKSEENLMNRLDAWFEDD